jgi:hydrogenase maturation protease
LEGFASTHAIDLRAAIELARALGKLPARLVIYGVEAEETGFGEGLSPACEAALHGLLQRIREECACTKPR